MRTYWEKLRDPQWQEKRLRIMERADFKCELCEAKTTLHVHHRIYRKGRDPWEYEDHELVCLCEPCHEYETSARAELAEVLVPLEAVEIETVTGFAQGIALLKAWHYERHVPDLKVSSNTYLGGLADALTIYWPDLAHLLDENQTLKVADVRRLYDEGHQRRMAENPRSFKG